MAGHRSARRLPDQQDRLFELGCPTGHRGLLIRVEPHTVGTLKRIIEIAIEAGSLNDNPVRFIKLQRERPKQMKLPTNEQFQKFVTKIESAGVCSCYQAVGLVRFPAFGGLSQVRGKERDLGRLRP
jgi:hypothetical protein